MALHRLKHLVCGGAVGLACLAVAPSHAYADETNAAAAEALFQEGIAAMKRNEYAVAAEAFLKSNRADPSPGTQINLALALEKQKKWASAWTWYRTAQATAAQRGQKPREQLAEESVARVSKQMHHVIVSIKEPLSDLVVKRDGSEVAITLGGKEVPLPVDPGEHTLEVTARGKAPWSTKFVAEDNPKTDRIEVPPLATAPVEERAPQVVGAGTDYRPPILQNDGSTQRAVGLVVAGAGVLSGLASIALFVLAGNEDDKASEYQLQYERLATDAERQDPRNGGEILKARNSRADAADNNRLIGYGLVGGAVVLVGVGAAVFFTAPRIKEKSAKVLPLLGPGFAGVSLGGTF